MKRIDIFLAFLVIFGGLMIIAGAVVMLKSVDFAPEALPFLLIGGIFALAGFLGLLWPKKKDKD